VDGASGGAVSDGKRWGSPVFIGSTCPPAPGCCPDENGTTRGLAAGSLSSENVGARSGGIT
jgi:hypothetical protein